MRCLLGNSLACKQKLPTEDYSLDGTTTLLYSTYSFLGTLITRLTRVNQVAQAVIVSILSTESNFPSLNHIHLKPGYAESKSAKLYSFHRTTRQIKGVILHDLFAFYEGSL